MHHPHAAAHYDRTGEFPWPIVKKAQCALRRGRCISSSFSQRARADELAHPREVRRPRPWLADLLRPECVLPSRAGISATASQARTLRTAAAASARCSAAHRWRRRPCWSVAMRSRRRSTSAGASGNQVFVALHRFISMCEQPLIAAYCVTEPGAGSDVAGVQVSEPPGRMSLLRAV